jgi:hypothetical protein
MMPSGTSGIPELCLKNDGSIDVVKTVYAPVCVRRPRFDISHGENTQY